jgi:ABC-2 type transport system permease protein
VDQLVGPDVLAEEPTGSGSQLVGMAGYITAIALLGLGLGIVLRSTAGSIGAVVGGILILPNIAGALLPDSWDTVLKFLPSSATASFTSGTSAGTSTLSAGAGVTVLVAWVVAALGAAIFTIRRRDV